MTGVITSLIIRRAPGKIHRTLGVHLPGEAHTLARVFKTVPAPNSGGMPGGATTHGRATAEMTGGDHEEIYTTTILALDLQGLTGPLDIEFAVELEFDDDGPLWGWGTITAQITGQPLETRTFGFGGVINRVLRLQFEVRSSLTPKFDHKEPMRLGATILRITRPRHVATAPGLTRGRRRAGRGRE